MSKTATITRAWVIYCDVKTINFLLFHHWARLHRLPDRRKRTSGQLRALLSACSHSVESQDRPGFWYLTPSHCVCKFSNFFRRTKIASCGGIVPRCNMLIHFLLALASVFWVNSTKNYMAQSKDPKKLHCEFNIKNFSSEGCVLDTEQLIISSQWLASRWGHILRLRIQTLHSAHPGPEALGNNIREGLKTC